MRTNYLVGIDFEMAQLRSVRMLSKSSIGAFQKGNDHGIQMLLFN